MNFRNTMLFCILFLGLGVSKLALGLTPPRSGCVAKPSDFALSFPFEPGEEVFVMTSYGDATSHSNCDLSNYANDGEGIDFQMTRYPDVGLGQPVLAIASGKVVLAGWSTEGWANYGQRVYIEHSYQGDGHKYISVYAHLNAISVSEGQQIEQGQPIGELGESCNGKIVDCGLDPHLHFALHQDSSLGGSGTGGSYGGKGVVPEPLGGCEGIFINQFLTSDAQGIRRSNCNIIVKKEKTVLDSRSVCFHRLGSAEDWHIAAGGLSDGFFWTSAKNVSVAQQRAYWDLNIEQAGQYHLAVFIPRHSVQLAAVTYLIHHEGKDENVEVDQKDVWNDWLSLGTYSFSSGSNQWLGLSDNIQGDSAGASIVFSALRIVPVESCECSSDSAPQQKSCAAGQVQYRLCDGCFWRGWWSDCGSTSDENSQPEGGDGNTPDGGGGKKPDGGHEQVNPVLGGCGCGSHPADRSQCLLLMMSLVLLVILRASKR